MTDFPEGFDQYLATRDRQRQIQVGTMLLWLTEREKLLVKEAAVMGFVQGTRFGQISEASRGPFPNDRDIVARVLLGADANQDLYPTLSKPPPPAPKRWYQRARRTRQA